MKNIIKLALLPCVAILTLAAAVPAQAVTVTSSAPTASSAMSGTTSSAKATSKQLKQQAKLRKQCAKLASGKLKAKKRAKLMAMCRTASNAVEDVTKVSSASAGAANASGSGAANASGSGAANAADTAVANANINSVIANSAPLFTGFPVAAAGAAKPADESFNPGSQASQGLQSIEDPQSSDGPSTEAEVTAVPEPGTLALLGLGLLGLGLARRRVAK